MEHGGSTKKETRENAITRNSLVFELDRSGEEGAYRHSLGAERVRDTPSFEKAPAVSSRYP
jgi:hypothetical protein